MSLMTRISRLSLATFLFVFAATTASAAPVGMNCPGGMSNQTANVGMTFGGSGIPKDAVCMATVGDVTVALTAHQRFSNPAVTNNGVDTYMAGTGGDSANGQPGYGVWNFGWYAHNSASQTNGQSYMVDLMWDTNPGLATDMSQMGHLRQQLAPGGTLQNSWNLGMGFIDTGATVPGIYSPATTLFNPSIVGNYSFALVIESVTGSHLGHVGMQVNTGAGAVPEPSTYGMMGLGLAALGLIARKRR